MRKHAIPALSTGKLLLTLLLVAACLFAVIFLGTDTGAAQADRERVRHEVGGDGDAPYILFDEAAGLDTISASVRAQAAAEDAYIATIRVEGTRRYYDMQTQAVVEEAYDETYTAGPNFQENQQEVSFPISYNGTFNITVTDTAANVSALQNVVIDTVLESLISSTLNAVYSGNPVAVAPLFFHPLAVTNAEDASTGVLTAATFNAKMEQTASAVRYSGLRYTGTASDGTEPCDAGEYYAHITVRGRNQTTNYPVHINIAKATPVLKDGLTKTVYYTPVASRTDTSQGTLKSINMLDAATNGETGAAVLGTCTWDGEDEEAYLYFTGASINGITQTATYNYTFTPEDETNYETTQGTVKVVLSLGVVINTNSGGSAAVSSDTLLTPHATTPETENPTVDLYLRASADAGYHFVSWQYDSTNYYLGEADQQLRIQDFHLLKSDTMGVLVTALFTRFRLYDGTNYETDNTDADSSTYPKVLTQTYSGAAASLTVATDVAAAVVGITGTTAADISYYDYVAYTDFLENATSVIPLATPPAAQGTYVAVYEAKVNGNSVYAAQGTKYVITPAALTVTASETGKDPVSGYAQSVSYTLRVSRVISTAVDGFQYSADGGSNWFAVPGTPTYESVTRNYTLVVNTANLAQISASHNGTVLFRGVESGVPVTADVDVVCKLDTVKPVFTVEAKQGAEAYDASVLNNWTNQAVDFLFTLNTVGESGAVVQYSVNGGAWLTVLNQEGNADIFFDNYTLTVADAQNATYRFRLRSATGVEAPLYAEGVTYQTFHVCIDNTAPEIFYLSGKPQGEGWHGTAYEINFRAREAGTPQSGLRSITVSPATVDSIPLDSAQVNFTLTIQDNRVYTVTVVDVAGNTSSTILNYNGTGNSVTSFQEKIDTVTPVITLADGSFLQNAWAQGTATIKLNVAAGASGVRLAYTVNGGDPIYAGDPEGGFFFEAGKETDVHQTHVFEVEFAGADGAHAFVFTAENGAGTTQEFDFGYVNFDTVKPAFHTGGATQPDGVINTWLHSLSYIQPSVWLNVPTEFRFMVIDACGDITVTVRDTVLDAAITLEKNPVGSVPSTANAAYHYYSMTLSRSGPFAIVMTDAAGNTATYELSAHIETQEGITQDDLSIAYEVYIADSATLAHSSSAQGEWESGWISTANHADKAHLRFVFDLMFTSSGGRVQLCVSDAAPDANSVWQNLTPILYDDDPAKRTDPKQTRTGYEYTFVTEMNGILWLRAATGSGIGSAPVKVGRVQLDRTPPATAENVYTLSGGGTASLLEISNNWRTGTVTLSHRVTDNVAGLSSYEVKRYAAGADYTSATPQETVTHAVTDGNLYSFTMDRYALYVITITDAAGNARVTQITPRLDNVTDFVLTVTAQNAGDSWITDAGTETSFAFTVTFDGGGTAFGPSGGKVEFQTNNDGVWRESVTLGGAEFGISNNGNATGAVFAMNAAQNNTYQFRAVAGNGAVYVLDTVYTVKKDDAKPTLSASFRTAVGGAAYAGSWVQENVIAALVMSFGISGGDYYYATTATEGGTLSAWTKINMTTFAAGEGLSGSYTVVTNESVELYYYFRAVSVAGVESDMQYAQVKIDKTVATLSVSAKLDGTDTDYVYGAWTDATVKFAFTVDTNPASGYKIEYLAYDALGNPQGSYVLVEGDFLNMETNRQQRYGFRVTTGANIARETELFSVNIDKTAPAFTAINTAGTRVADGDYAGWYTTEASFTFAYTAGASGAVAEYSYREWNAAENEWSAWSTWTSEGISSSTLTVTDGGAGGKQFAYKFRLKSGAGHITNYADGAEQTVNVDTKNYTVTLVQSVMTTAVNLATATNTDGYSYKRGGTVSSVIGLIAGAGAYLKSVGVYAGDTLVAGTDATWTAEDACTAHTVSTGMANSDLEIRVYLYKVINVAFENLTQHLQNGASTAVTVQFGSDYNAALANEYTVYYTAAGEAATDVLPTGIGVYEVSATLSDEIKKHFILDESAVASSTLTIRYYENAGTALNPYEIRKESDLLYIDVYMNTGAETDYLGNRGEDANFLQTANLFVDDGFTPVGTARPFAGTYRGGNRTVTWQSQAGFLAAGVREAFGFFAQIDGGTVRDLGVLAAEMRVTAANAAVGLLVGDAKNATVQNCYAFGDIRVITGADFSVGGLVGKAAASVLYANFADVRIRVEGGSGAVGGLVGAFCGDSESAAVNFHSNFTVSALNLVLADAASVHAGSLIGNADTEIRLDDTRPNRFHQETVTVKAVSGTQAIGNDRSGTPFQSLVALTYAEFLEESTPVGDAGNETVSPALVKNLAALRFGLHNIAQTGTETSPILVSQEAHFAYLDIFPWAAFLVTNDMLFAAPHTPLGAEVPFRGSLSGAAGGITALRGVEITAGACTGFFAKIDGGTVTNLSFADMRVTADADTAYAYAGGVVADAKNAVIKDINVSGTLTAKNTAVNSYLYVGSVAGLINSSVLENALTLMELTVTESVRVLAGGFAGQVELAEDKEAALTALVSVAVMDVQFSRHAYAGLVAGAVYNDGIIGANLYHVTGNAYAAGTAFTAAVGQNKATAGFSGSTGAAYGTTLTNVETDGIKIGGAAVDAGLKALYPFASGRGIPSDPFLVMNYNDLLKMNDYLYAHFKLGADIVIGDTNGDGALTAEDGYAYTFEPIGKGKVFTGALNGDNKYAVNNLHDALFDTLNGELKNLTVEVNIKRYTAGDAALAEPTNLGAKAVEKDASFVIGALANTVKADANLSGLVVTGSIEVRLAGASQLRVGGIAGVLDGATVMSSVVTLSLKASALRVQAGGIAGEVYGEATLSRNMTREDITAAGASVNAGLVAGALLTAAATLDTAAQEKLGQKVHINGTASETLFGVMLR